MRAFAVETGIALRDAVLLVPYAQLLEPARRALADIGGWMPRVETTQTLARALGPSPAAEAGQISFNVALDGLTAAQLLRGQRWGATLARRDPRGFAHAVAGIVETAHALARGAAAIAPSQRDDHWTRGRALLMPISGPGQRERLLARIALEWACLAAAPATDRLFGLAPSAWIVVQAGGVDPLCAALRDAGGAICLWLDADADAARPLAEVESIHAPALAVCAGFEDEAEAAAAQAIAYLRAGERPVALIAQDRVLVRRVRALLERRRVAVLDETGWKLSTTRAAVPVVGLLEAARPDASTDALLDALKAIAGIADVPSLAHRIDALEALCRRAALRRVAALSAGPLEAGLQAWWTEVQAWLAPLSERTSRSLADWLAVLTQALRQSGAWAGLVADEAGRQVLAALHLDPLRPDTVAPAGALALPLTRDDFAAWVHDVLEEQAFRPAAPGVPPDVVITPLARAVLRPFAAVVLPGADDQHLGGEPPRPALLADAEAAALGLPTAADRRAAELQAFVHLLRAPALTLLRRRADGRTPVGTSPLVSRLGAALARSGRGYAIWIDPRQRRRWPVTPVERPAPIAPAALLPQALSASAVEALRACPYRYYATYLLGVRERDELDDEVDKRDYGNWLHAVLDRFHRERGDPRDDEALLQTIADEVRAADDLDAAHFEPFGASFAAFVPRYLRWLHARDADGVRWRAGEHEVAQVPDGFGGVRLEGRIDRVDARRTPDGEVLELIDYKTSSATDLRDKVAEPLEDTQLAVYAALMRTPQGPPLRALYLALESREKMEVEHRDVEQSAAALVAGLAHDLERLRAGHPMPALGEGRTCEHCAARGLCRRDHWASPSADEPASEAAP
ncbi:MAG: PD-(D/E)XK nuclease family protein [Proteobacteria bacterium]|nr:PD-(D/E)XK nuclease family protein [Pseudomonadota bacterium]